MPPAIRRLVGLLNGERKSPAGRASQVADEGQLGLSELVVGGEISVGNQLDDAFSGSPEGGRDPRQFSLRGGEGADIGPAAGPVSVGAGGGKTERPGFQRL